MANIFKKNNLTYSPFSMQFPNSDIIGDLKREVGNEHGSKFLRWRSDFVFNVIQNKYLSARKSLF